MEGNSHMNTNGEEQEVKKKKKIIAVYNTHNSKTGIKDPRAEKKQQAARQAQSRPAAAKPAAAEEDVKEPPKEIVTAQIAGIEPSGSIRERKQTGRPGETDTES